MVLPERDNKENIRLIGIEEEMSNSYLDYAMSVIVSRALPDVRDGLKPVQRRILYSMYDTGMRANSSFKKSARLVGEVMGKYHPHGDSAIYEAMVRMAQSWSMRYMLVEGQGNFGSTDGDSAAAMRYTEAKLQPISDAMLSDIEKETVPWNDNFDASIQEPSTLPARLPNLLVNGVQGIAVGMATNMAPHNLSEVCDAIIEVIDNPECSVEDLMEHIKAPDFPTAAHIWGIDGVRSAYATGRGRVMIQANHKVEFMNKQEDRIRLVFDELPYQVNKANLVIRIAELLKTKKIEGISEVRDESDRKGTRLVVELKRGASEFVVLNNLYKQTPLRSSFSINMVALVDGSPRVLNLKQILKYYVDFRIEIVTKRAEFELRKAQSRIHILEGLRIALQNIDDVIETIKSAGLVEEAREALMSKFSMTEIQAQAVLDMQLRRIAALETEKIESEYNELKDLIKDLNELLGSKEKIFDVIKQETSELKEKYGDKRLTKLHKQELGQWNREDVEPHEESVVTLSRNGYLKRVKSDTFRRQHRGGKGVKGQKMTKEDDVTPYMQIADTHDTILLFTDRGRVFSSRVFDLPANQSRNSRGTPVHNIVALEAREKVNAILTVPEIDQKLESYIVMATKNGRIKTMEISKFKNLRKSGLHSFKLKSDDELVSVALALPLIEVEKNNIIKLVANKKNPDRGISYVLDSLTEIDTGNIDKDLINPDPKNKKRDINILKKEGGRKYFSILDNKGKETASKIYPDIVMVSDAGKQIRFNVESVRPQGRIAGGVKGMKLDSKQRVVAMVLTSKDPNSYIMVASQKGFGKLSKMEHFKVQKQGGTGLMTMKITTKNGKVADVQAVKLDKEAGTSDSVYLLTEKAVVQEIPMDEISIYGRSTQGSTLMKLQPGDKISAIRAVSSDSSTREEESKKGDSKKKSKK